MAKMGRRRGKRIRPDPAIRMEDIAPLIEQIRIANPTAREYLAHAILRQHRLLQELGAEVDRLAVEDAAPSDRQAAAMTRAALGLGTLLEKAGLTEMKAFDAADEL